jgi:hypothetical protein
MKNGYLCKIIPIYAGLIIIAEGSFIFSVAGPAVIDGLGGIMKSTVQLGGLQLLFIGLITLASSIYILYFLSERGRIGLLRRVLRFVVASTGLVVAVEGVVLAFMAGKTTIDGFGTSEVYIVAGFAAQLFFLGMAIMIPAILQKKEIGLRKLLVYGGGTAVSSAGLIIIGDATFTIIQGIGGILTQQIELAGEQLFFLGLAIVVLSLLLDLTNKFRLPLTTLRYLATFMVTVEGLVLIAFATPINIEGIGWIASRVIILSGFGLAMIGLFTLFATGLKTQKLPPRLRKMTMGSVIMLALLLPVAALTIGKIF